MLVVESLEESFHQFMSARVRLFQVGNLVKGIGKIASSSSRDFHLGENLRILLENRDVGVREKLRLASLSPQKDILRHPHQ